MKSYLKRAIFLIALLLYLPFVTNLILPDQVAKAAPLPISVLGSPSSNLSNWDGSFNWSGVSGATYYFLQVQSTSGLVWLEKWFSSASVTCVDPDLTCSVIPPGLLLPYGDYKWRIVDYGISGYGVWSNFQNFTLVAPAVSLPGSPYSYITSWDRSFQWTGVTGSTSYLLQIQDISTDNIWLEKWFTSTETACINPDTTCSVVPPGLLLPVGEYRWRVLDYNSGGYGRWSAYRNFILDIGLQPSGETLLAPVGTLTSQWNALTSSWTTPWDKTFRWTGVVGADSYSIEIQTAGGVVRSQKWYSLAEANCALTTNCNVIPSVLGFPINESGSYRWRIMDHNPAYGDSNWSAFTYFNLSILSPSALITLGAPSGSQTLSAWNLDKSLNWTGINGATSYQVEVREAGDHILMKKWVTAASALCDTDLICTLTPSELSALPVGNYKWHVLDYGVYGYGTLTAYTNFTLLPCYSLTTTINPPASLNSVSVITAPNCTSGSGYIPGTVVQISPVPNGSYLFRDWSGGANGNANPIPITINSDISISANFIIPISLISPVGTLSNWDKSFKWIGVTGATSYFLRIKDTGSGLIWLERWFSPAEAGCTEPGPLNCSVIPSGFDLPAGNYSWQVQDSGSYGSGFLTPFSNFSTLSITPVTTLIPLLPTGSISRATWDGSFQWTGNATASNYLLQVKDSGGLVWLENWYDSASKCDTSHNCSVIPSGLLLPDGTYTWRVIDYGSSGYGSWTSNTGFVMNP